jgi:serine/threonine protein kinase
VGSRYNYFPYKYENEIKKNGCCITGVLIYEMLAGFPPFFDDNPFGIYEKILACKLEWPRSIDPIAKDLVKKLLVADRTKRLGNMKVNRS